MTIAWHVVGYCIWYGRAVYGRPYGLVPKHLYFPIMSQMLFTVRHESRRCKFVKMLERRAASGGENPKNLWPTNT